MKSVGRHRVFVYGTLKRGGENHHFLHGQEFLGHARTAPGYRLYQMHGYPGMVPEPADARGVAGEVWTVDDAALEALDAFEGVPEGLYERVAVRLLPPFDHEPVMAYLYLQEVAGRPVLGDHWPV